METLFRWLQEEVALEGVRGKLHQMTRRDILDSRDLCVCACVGCPVRRLPRLIADRAKEYVSVVF